MITVVRDEKLDMPIIAGGNVVKYYTYNKDNGGLSHREYGNFPDGLCFIK